MKTAVGYTFNFDVDQFLDTPTETPDLQELCFTDLSESLNEVIDTYFRNCDNGFSQNALTAIDAQYDLTVKDGGGTAFTSILENKYDIDKRNRAAIQVIDNESGQTLDWQVTLTAISDTRTVQAVNEYSITFKGRGEPTIA